MQWLNKIRVVFEYYQADTSSHKMNQLNVFTQITAVTYVTEHEVTT